jgi:Cys-tRNA(Pro) deacylase
MTSSELAAFIATHNITAKIIHMAEHTPTVEMAAQALGVQPEQVGKSILFVANDTPTLVVACGTNRIDYKKLADHLGLSRKRLRIASPEEVFDLAGYAVGAMPPFGHKIQLRTILDARVLTQTNFYAGGGDINAMLHVAPHEIQRVSNAEVVEVTSS